LTSLGVWIGVILVVALLVGLDRIAIRVLQPVPRPFERSVSELDIPAEEFRVSSGEHQLACWLLLPAPAQPFEPLIVLAHGWGANHSTVMRLGEPLAREGHDVLLFDVRGHGRNPRLPAVTIRDFRDDLMAVVRHVAKRFPDRQLVLVGHSMGGAAAVLVAADGAPVDGLVLIAAPSDVLRVTREYLIDSGLPGGLMVNVLRPFWWRRVRSTFRPLTPSRRIRELDLPVLMIQPEHDTRVIRSHADRLAAAAGLEYHLIAGREHTDVLSAPETLALVEDFLEQL
jgi:alpha-beta hydrolase superfamily lysophospholipase